MRKQATKSHSYLFLSCLLSFPPNKVLIANMLLQHSFVITTTTLLLTLAKTNFCTQWHLLIHCTKQGFAMYYLTNQTSPSQLYYFTNQISPPQHQCCISLRFLSESSQSEQTLHNKTWTNHPMVSRSLSLNPPYTEL